jgi:glutaredoxin 2
MVGLKTSVKAVTTLLEKVESKMSRQAENIVKLLQDVKGYSPKLAKPHHVSLEAPEEALAEAGDTLKRKGIGYSLTKITSGIVKKRQFGKSGKTCGIFAKDWPEWLTMESAFDMNL